MQYTAKYASPLGEILLASDDEGLTGLWFDKEKYYALHLDPEHTPKETPAIRQARAWLDLYFAGKEPDFLPPIHMIGTPFQKDVWRILLQIPYGKTATYGDIAKRLGDAGIVDEKEFLKKAEKFRPYDYIEKHDDTFYACEGFLFPDTYVLKSDYDVDSILKEMASDFDQRLTPKLRARAKQMNLSIYELVTLASLVEKEAKFEEDRPKVAQVFLKRLKIGMPLQSDTTFQYLRDDPKEDLSLADTKVDSPYNTYQHKGLPPGPIASPGMAAIEAVLYPADTDYLYFVADRDGHNHYSTNYADHEAIVEEVR